MTSEQFPRQMIIIKVLIVNYPPASEASREVANLTETKNPHTPVYGVKEFVRLSVCLLQNLTAIILGLAKQLIFLSSNQNHKPIKKKFSCVAARAVFISMFFFKNSSFMTFWQEIITLTHPIRRMVKHHFGTVVSAFGPRPICCSQFQWNVT